MTLILATGLVALVAGLWSQSDWLMAVYWRRQLTQTPEPQAAALLRQMGRGDEACIPVLVEALNSPRQRVAQESREVLWESVLRWDRLPQADASRRRWLLAESLAEQVNGFRPSAQVDAAQLASQILMRPIDETIVPPWQVTAACEQVLTAAEPARAEQAKTLAATPAREVPDAATSSTEAKGQQAPRPNQPSSVQAAEGQDGTTREPLAQARTEPASILNQPSRLLDVPEQAAIIRSEAPPAPPRPQASPEPPRIVREIPKPVEEPLHVAPELLEIQEPVGIDVETVELMRRLRSIDPATEAAARAELVRRGFSEVQLELALRLFDPDPEVRKQLVRTLPEMRSIDASPWLLQLCRDQNPDVRRSAFTLMATTTDPRLIERLIQIARQDPDSTIKRHAERLANRRDEARRPAPGRMR